MRKYLLKVRVLGLLCLPVLLTMQNTVLPARQQIHETVRLSVSYSDYGRVNQFRRLDHLDSKATDDKLWAMPGHTQGGINLNRSFEGISGDANVYVPDPTLAVGPDSIILVTNGPLEIRTKMGVVVASTLLEAFFSSVQTSNEGAYDPQIVFDPDSERFFLAATGFVRDSLCDPGECISNIFLAVSTTSSPETFSPTDWYFYISDASLIEGAPTANWADRPRLGVNKDIVAIAYPLFRAIDSEFMGETVRIFEKSKLIAGQNVAGTDFHGMNVEGNLARTMQPVLHFDDTDVFFLLSHGGGPTWSCETVWGISNALTSPTLTYVPFSGFNEGCTIPPDAAQPGEVCHWIPVGMLCKMASCTGMVRFGRQGHWGETLAAVTYQLSAGLKLMSAIGQVPLSGNKMPSLVSMAHGFSSQQLW